MSFLEDLFRRQNARSMEERLADANRNWAAEQERERLERFAELPPESNAGEPARAEDEEEPNS